MKKNIQINSDALPFILDGKSVLAPGVLNVADDIEENDYCVITTEINSQKRMHCRRNFKRKFQELQQMVENHQGFLEKSKIMIRKSHYSQKFRKGIRDLIPSF